MKKLLIFLDELYHQDGNDYISNYAAGSFFDDIEKAQKTFLVPVANNDSQKPKQYSTKIESKDHKVIPLPEWNSLISYLKVSRSSNFKKILKTTVDESIKANDVIWIRVPSLLGLKLAQRAIAHKKRVIFHYAGDIENAWKNNKYSGIKKVFAFFQSQYMHKKVMRLSKSKYVSNLCTGSALYDIVKTQNKNTEFFIDSKILKKDLHQHEYDKDCLRFVFIGRLTEDKGVTDLLNIFESLDEKGKAIKLSIIGFGELEDDVKQTIKNSKHSDRYNYIGYVPNHEVNQYLAKNDILILPSKYPSEGFPRVIIEAWANSLMVVGTKAGGIEGLGVHNKNIIFSPFKDFEALKNNIKDVVEGRHDLVAFQKYILEHRDNITYEYYKSIAEKHIYEL